MVRFNADSANRLLLSELQRRAEAAEVRGASLLNNFVQAPDEYALYSSGDGSVAALKPVRAGVAPAERLHVIDSDSGAVVEVAKRSEDVELAGTKFHQYQLNPLSYECDASNGRPRITLEGFTGKGGTALWSSDEDLLFVRDLAQREGLVVRPNPELGSGPTAWFDVSSDVTLRSRIEKALGFSVPDVVHQSTIDQAVEQGADVKGLGFETAEQTTTESPEAAALRQQLDALRGQLAVSQANEQRLAVELEQAGNEAPPIREPGAPKSNFERIVEVKQWLEKKALGRRGFVGARFSQLADTKDLDRPKDLRTAWNVQVRLGKKYSNVPLSPRIVEAVGVAMARAGLVPPGKENEVADLLRGIWFGRGSHVPAFFESVLSRPELESKVMANLAAYNEIIADSNFDALFPNSKNRPEDLLKRAAFVGFFAREDDFRRTLFDAIEADFREEALKRVTMRREGKNTELDVAVIGSGPTGTAFSKSFAATLEDQGEGARITVFDDTLQDTFRFGAFWRLNSPSRAAEGTPGVPGKGDINYQSAIVGTPDAQGGFWASADSIAQTGAVELHSSGVPVELFSTVSKIERNGDGRYRLQFADGSTQVSRFVIAGAGLGRGAKLYPDAATNEFVRREYELNTSPSPERLFNWLYRDSLQLFESAQKLNVPLAAFAPTAEMTPERYRKLERNCPDELLRRYVRTSAPLPPGDTLKDTTVKPQQVVAIIGSGDGGNTVAELLSLLGPTREADRTPAQLGIRPQVLWFVGEKGPAECTEFYVGQLDAAFAGVQQLFDTDPELQKLNFNVAQYISREAAKAASSGSPEQSLQNALAFVADQFLGVDGPRKFIAKTFAGLSKDKLTDIEQAFLKSRGAVRPRYNQLVQPIAKGQLKLVTEAVEKMQPTQTELGEKLVVTSPRGERFLVDRAVGCIGNDNGVEDVISDLLDGKKGKLPVLKDPSLYEFIELVDTDGERKPVGKRLKSDPNVIFLGPGAIADFQQNKTAVGANTVSIFLNKPLNDLVGEDLAKAVIRELENMPDAKRKERARADEAYADGLAKLDQQQLVGIDTSTKGTIAASLGPADNRLRKTFAEGGGVAFDIEMRAQLARFRGEPGSKLTIEFKRGAGDELTIVAPDGARSPLQQLAQETPAVTSYLRSLKPGVTVRITRTCDENGCPTLVRGETILPG